ncbi:MAG: UDP-N-acetylmuramoyl-L-alanyl-D-glutamate--2,6-diaminopimelate ligase [Oscillospiraceae bacterium]|jgi:UDP-N-acetylmuramoyl-L-alanyl-D-glutamate--2,6-diaminopimelate ligase|nr:UDP-N-acetylmuramoyl-L-alanyl-D-glutamate--2,6-diaminopimelate ligase [Oscillospiraceae bacterium]
MTLQALLDAARLPAGSLAAQALALPVTRVTDRVDHLEPDCVFVCIAGAKFDGHDAAPQATAAGAALVVVGRPMGQPRELIAADPRAAYARLCAAFFGNPADALTLIGITGTNGKTTTAFLLKEILEFTGQKTGLIGTVQNMVGDESFPAALTTPDPWDLHALFAQMVGAGCSHCVMEASSQALAQRRVSGLRFRAAVFTNLTQDHLDYHGTFQAYREAKRQLFAQCDIAVINRDDEAGPAMLADSPARAVTYSIHNDRADYTAKNLTLQRAGVSYELVTQGRIGRVQFAMPGEFSAYNSLAAAAVALELGLELPAVLEALGNSRGVPGRMELVPTGTAFSVVIDYAHTPDGLDNVLRALRGTTAGRLITVLGCGGDRDKTKRPVMGRLAADRSDVVIVTSDNPRTENPDAIIEDILAGVRHKSGVFVEPDRRRAIALALKKARAGDVVLLAGKGQETYQILGAEKIFMDEREIVREILFPPCQ